ncbi:hypothetical protein O181_028456 [Austropuccinia psidii MF-1]|uniref:Uncharacterized protein n=1 Tax=Austropuccinia psidii MF-1 TaxID=1389203 RepID=A0A9Q3H2E3_9BASI|nr:hypothetical protein [Austropuccinia psidii MF-1]
MLAYGTQKKKEKTISFENDKYSVDSAPSEWCIKQYKRLKSMDLHKNNPMRNKKLLIGFSGELEHASIGRCNKDGTVDYISNTLKEVRKKKNIGKYSLYQQNSFREKQNFSDFKKKKPEKKWQKYLGKRTLVTMADPQTTILTTV